MKRAMESLIETFKAVSPLKAKLARTYYDAYLAAGFSDAQAFELATHALDKTRVLTMPTVVDKDIALRTLQHMEPEHAKRCLAAPALWLFDGAYCSSVSGVS